jgi:hypothetical protein
LSGVAARVVGAEEQLECIALMFDPADPIAIASADKELCKRQYQARVGREPRTRALRCASLRNSGRILNWCCWGGRHLHA